MKKKIYHHVALGLTGAVALLLAACSEAPAPKTTTQAEETEAPRRSKTKEWMHNFEEAKAKAQAEKKPILVYFTGSDWCTPCIVLDRRVLTKPEFENYITKHFVLLELDFPRLRQQDEALKAQNTALYDKYGLIGFPSLVVLKPDGELVAKVYNMAGDVPKYLAWLKEAEAKAVAAK